MRSIEVVDYFIRPPFVSVDSYTYRPKMGIKTYTEYNYLRKGIGSFLRTRHFEYALRLTKEYFHKYNVIDFGCADGAFLPSLSKYFNNVVGIDIRADHLRVASKLIETAGLNNVRLICNKGKSFDGIVKELGNEKFSIVYILETLEHVGKEDPDIWEFRVQFVKNLFDLIEKDGIVVISVPNMIGLQFLAQRIGLSLFRAEREAISIKNLVRASLFSDTNDLEKQWNGSHVGFNHVKMESYLWQFLDIVRTKHLLFQVIWVCRRKI